MKMICSVCQKPLEYKVENDDPDDFTYEVEPCASCLRDAKYEGRYDEDSFSLEPESE